MTTSIMCAANFVEPGHIEMRGDASKPSAGAGEVLVAVRACGICGSDLHMFRNNSLRSDLVRQTPEGYDIPGHEFAGTIAEIGEGVSGWNLGERVVGVTGQGGGMAEYVTVPVNPFQLVRVPEGVGFDAAATTEPLADGLQMVRKARLSDGENVVVIGVGIIGLGVIQAIKARGIQTGQIIAVDVQDARLTMAEQVGATATVNPRNGDVFEQIATLCGRHQDYRGESANIDVVFDCAGYIKHIEGPPPLEIALHLISTVGGRIICFGAYEDRMLIDMHYMITKEPVLMGSNGYAAEELEEALDLMQSGAVNRLKMISHRYPLDQIAEAFAMQGRPEAVKVMLEIGR